MLREKTLAKTKDAYLLQIVYRRPWTPMPPMRSEAAAARDGLVVVNASSAQVRGHARCDVRQDRHKPTK